MEHFHTQPEHPQPELEINQGVQQLQKEKVNTIAESDGVCCTEVYLYSNVCTLRLFSQVEVLHVPLEECSLT